MRRLTTLFVSLFVAMLLLFLSMPTGAQAEALLFCDFDTGRADEWDEQRGNWSVVGKEYDVVELGGEAFSFIGDNNWEDYSVEAKVKIIETPVACYNAGICFRVEDEDVLKETLMIFILAENQMICFYQKDKGVWTRLLDAPFPHERKRWYTMRVDVEGKTFKAYIDDELVLEDESETIPAKGRVGLRGYSAHNRYDDFIVFTEGDRSRPVSPKGKLAATWGSIKHSY